MFKNRALIWQDEKPGDKIFFDGLTALTHNDNLDEN